MNANTFTIALVSWDQEQQNISSVREQVFIHEQHVPPELEWDELEWDELDQESIQVLATSSEHTPIGTARMIHGHIGRMCVLSAWRNRGVGSALLNTLLGYAHTQRIEPIWLNAQTSATGFYEKHGFISVGKVFMDANIPHLRMEYSAANR